MLSIGGCVDAAKKKQRILTPARRDFQQDLQDLQDLLKQFRAKGPGLDAQDGWNVEGLGLKED